MTQPPQLPKKFCVSGKKYRVLGLAGSGGYAQVFKVEDANEKIYAVKKYVKMKAVSIQSAHTEVKMLKNKLLIYIVLVHSKKNYQHENIIKLIDYEFKKVSLLSKNYVLTIVMEYCHNDLVGEVKRVMHKNESFPEKRILLILVDVLAALSYLHSNDIIHRDVKLDNVLVRPDSSCVLCDFGSCATSPILLNTASYEKAAKDVSK
ncbi:MAG: Cell cycle serine/threonine-protein kinase cdc5/MSD2 [Paramarteilia canceri]